MWRTSSVGRSESTVIASKAVDVESQRSMERDLKSDRANVTVSHNSLSFLNHPIDISIPTWIFLYRHLLDTP
jgi:hypothetical protein